MEDLNSIGLRIDRDEKLRIISEVTEEESTKLASNLRQLFEGLVKVQDHLTKTAHYLRRLDEQEERSLNVSIAANIAEIITSKRQAQ